MGPSRNVWGMHAMELPASAWISSGNFIFSGNPPQPAINRRKCPRMYAKLFEKLHSGHVEFLVLGEAAVSLHGYSRMTTDIDIILQNSPGNIGRFVSAISQWGEGCGSTLTYDDFQGPGCIRIEEEFPLDVFTVLSGKSFEHFAANATHYLLAGGLSVRCLSISDLIEVKKGTFREKDQLDVTVLRRLQKDPPKDETPTINLSISSPPLPRSGDE
jgi:hypothetical protein